MLKENNNTMKKICKFMKIKKYSGLNKGGLNLIINKQTSILKIQRWIRKILARGSNCPISLEIIRYPCYYTKNNGIMIYYNLEPLKNSLIKTGNFKDPITRIVFTNKQLIEMDNIDIYYNKYTKCSPGYKSVYEASTNENYYKKMKEDENEILFLERILYDLVNESVLYTSNIYCSNTNLNHLFLNDYKKFYKNLQNKSNNFSEHNIDQSINYINNYIKDNDNIYDIVYIKYIIKILSGLKYKSTYTIF